MDFKFKTIGMYYSGFLVAIVCVYTFDDSGHVCIWYTPLYTGNRTRMSRLFQAVAGRRRHVPYRDHKLTSLLRDAVGGTAKVLMLLGPPLDPVGFVASVFGCHQFGGV